MTEQSSTETVSAFAVLSSLPQAVLAVDPEAEILFANPSAETLFGLSGTALIRQSLARLVGTDSPLLTLIGKARAREMAVTEQALDFGGPGIGRRSADISAAPLTQDPKVIIVTLRERTVMDQVGQPDSRREAMRPVIGMAALLAHEIKNPLSGIKGAAQLLNRKLGADGADLTRLIEEEVDRIAELVDRMDVFREQMDFTPEPVNIHEVLGHVRQLAQAGFGAGVVFEERYDPSLPPAAGGRTLLTQAFLNLIKNACEACGPGGRVVLATGYRHDIRMTGPKGRSVPHMPLEIRVEDNGPGIPPAIMRTLFEPFVGTRQDGKGLGLALVAKAIADHGGVVHCESRPGHTVFITRLPMATAGEGSMSTDGAPA